MMDQQVACYTQAWIETGSGREWGAGNKRSPATRRRGLKPPPP
ncbi:hypothetical protein [Alicyclobacillus tolerans]